MTWSTPLTAVTNTALTAAQWNASVRDNLLETAPAKATTASSLFVSTGANAIAERRPAESLILTQETTTSTSFTDLATSGPAVTATTGGRGISWITCQVRNSSTGSSVVSVAYSGAFTGAASDDSALINDGGSGDSVRASLTNLMTAMTAGSTTFTMKYRVSSNTGTFSRRQLTIMPL